MQEYQHKKVKSNRKAEVMCVQSMYSTDGTWLDKFWSWPAVQPSQVFIDLTLLFLIQYQLPHETPAWLSSKTLEHFFSLLDLKGGRENFVSYHKSKSECCA